MQRSCAHLLRLLLCISSLTALLYPYAALAQTCEKPVATVVSVQGTVESQRVGEPRSGSRRNSMTPTAPVIRCGCRKEAGPTWPC